jgi:AraC-like DNA-binding protein
VNTGDVLVMPRPISYRVHFPQDAQHPYPADHKEITDMSKPALKDIEYVGMVCQLDKAHRNLLTDFLPLVIHLKKDTPGLARWFKRTVELFRAESQTHALGRASILARLTEMVCVQVLRIWIEQLPGETRGWLKALRDERIAMAIQAVHADPAKRWTVASLARRAGMSRTIFSTRFKALVGESPMTYVSRWRMHRAAGLLGAGTSSLKSVAEASGYRSRATFGANFKRYFGILPSDYRKS